MKRFDTAFLMVLLLLFLAGNTALGQHFEPAADQGASHSLVLRTSEVNGESLTNDDEIAVFTPDGVCAGVVVIDDDPPWGLAAFGDNPITTDEVEGFLSGEEFAFRFWDASAEEEEELHVEWDGEPQTWENNGVGNILRLLYFSDPVPVIALSDDGHDFETMGVDNSREWTLTITNIGFGVLTIEDVSLDNQAFGTNFENEVEVDVYESYELVVNFTPPEAGDFEGTLTIVNDDPDNEDAQVTLTGTGTEVIEPDITFDYEEIDFGEWPVERGLAKVFNLTISNVGTGDLTISNAEVTGDEVFDLNWDGEVVVEPFNEYVLGVVFEPEDEDTDYEGTLTVSSDDPDDEEVVFDLLGRGVEVTSHYVWVNGATSHSLLINQCSINGDRYEIRDEIAVFTPEGVCAGGDMVTDPDDQLGFGAWAYNARTQTPGFRRNGDEIEFRIWDASAEIEYYPEVQYIHGPDVFQANAMSVVRLTAATPNEPIINVLPLELEIDYGDVGINLSEEREIRIRNHGAVQLRVTHVESSEPDIFVPDFEVGFVLDYMEERAISVAFEPDDLADFTGEISITSNSSDEPVIVDVMGSGIDPPAIIQIEEREHDFGQIEQGTEDSWEFVITNIGLEILTIDSLISNNEAFTHDFGVEAVELEQDDEITVTVTFSADEVQEYDGIITVYNNDPDEEDQEIEIALSGEGIVVPDIRLSRTFVDFGEVEILTEDTFVISVFNDGEADLHVTDITMGGDDAAFFDTDYDGEFVVETDAEHEIEIAFNPVPIREYSAEFRIISNDLDENDVRVRLAGIGIYVAHDPEVEHAIPDQNLQEDFEEFIVANLDTVFFDPNDEDMEFSAEVNRNRLHVEIRDGSLLWLWADENWNGSGTVTVTADDGMNRDNGPVRSLRGAGSSTPVTLSANRVARNSWGINNPARDGEGEDEFDVNVEAENDEPEWTVVPDPITEDENVEIAFTVEGEDPDDDALTITYTSDDIPDDVSFTDNEDGTADFAWTPTYDDAGNYTATFTLSDAEYDIETDVEIEVTNVNSEPVWDEIEDRYEVAENDELNVTIAGSDPDDEAVTIAFTSDDLPEEFEFTDNEDGTGTMVWQTDYDDAGEYTATFTISDGNADVPYDVTIVVINNNRMPEWTDVPEEVAVEVDVDAEELIEFTVVGTDADGTGNLEITYTSDDIPEAAGFEDTGDGEGDFSWTVTIDDAGSYTATFTLSDGEDEVVAETRIVIIGTNQPPEWVEVDDTDEWPGQLEVDENQTLDFTVHGTDPDEDDVADLEIIYSSDDLPDAVSFEDQGEGVGAFSWEAGYLDAGEYTATFTITDGIYNVDGNITIVVNNINRDPVWDEIPGEAIEINESEQVQFNVAGSDPDEDDELTLTYNSDNLPEEVVFEDNGDGTASFTWDTGYLDAGDYTVTFNINDGYTDVVSDEVSITVNDRNAPPEWTDYPESIRASEGDLIDVDVTAEDVDEDNLTLTATDLPEGCSFTDNNDGTGTMLWETDHEDEGEYTVTLIASDDEFDIEIEIPIEITNINQAPEWTFAPEHVNIEENEDWSLTVEGEDVDGDDLSIEYESDDLPEAATFEDHGDGTATLSWQPGYDEDGEYEATFILSDGIVPNRTLVRITVDNIDRAPVWDDEPGDVDANEGDLIEFSMAGSDPDGDDLTILYSSNDLPDAVDFMDHGDGTGDFSWQTGFEDDGNYTATFTLSSNDLEAEMEVNISIGNVNHEPEWIDFPGSQHGELGDLIEFELSGEDEDDDDLTVTYTPDDNLPAAGEVFADNGDGTATFSWQTDGDDTGTYLATFTLSDGGAEVTDEVIITVGDVNQPPAWTDIPGSFTINENVTLNFDVTGEDPDDDALTITTGDLPDGAEFIDNEDGTGDFTWQPDYEQSGHYVIVFTISDGNYDMDEDVRITVNDFNRDPEWGANMPPRSPSGDENSTLSFVVRGSDPDGSDVSIRMESDELPRAAEFVDNGDGTGDFTWETTYDDEGSYLATFYLSDGENEIEGESNIRVTNVNRTPEWVDPQEAITTDEGEMVRFRMRGFDPDGLENLDIAFDEDGLPEEAEFEDYGEGYGFFTWPTNFDDVGEYTATFMLTDGEFNIEHEVPITIEYVNRAPFWVHVPEEVEGDENEWIAFNVAGDDPDDDDELTIVYQSGDIPDDVTFTDNEDGTGTFWWQPTFDEAGEYTAEFTISDNNGLEVTESTTITVVDVNRSPEWDEDLPQAVRIDENQELVVDVSGSDPDGDDLNISYESDNIPDDAEFTDNEDGTGSLIWTPSFDDAGEFQATFTISDGELEDTYRVIIAVNHVNRQPEITELDPGAEMEIEETDEAIISLTATDPDDDNLTIHWESDYVSNNVEFYDNDDGTANFIWTTNYEDAGEHTVTFIVTDGDMEVTEDVIITVTQQNREPFWVDVPEEIETDEERSFDFIIEGSDPDGVEDLEIAYNSDDLPDNVRFLDMNNGRGRFTWRPTIDESGEYSAVFTLSDGEFEVEAEMAVIVYNVNRNPYWDADPDSAEVDEDQLLEFTVTGNDDDDEDVLTISYNLHDLPDDVEFTDNEDGTGDFVWTPGFEDAGEHTAVFTLSDGENSVDKEVIIIVNDVNRAPEWSNVPEDTITGDEPNRISFIIEGIDYDNDDLTIEAVSDNLPEAAEFTDRGDGLGSFVWQTTHDDAGEYSVTFTLSDGVEADELTVNIIVNDVNQAPRWTNVPGEVYGYERRVLEFSVAGDDDDNDDLTISYSSDDIPEGAEFTDNHDGTASLVWTPGNGEEGEYTAHFVISDGELTDEADVTVEIAPDNRPPYFVSIPDRHAALESDEWVSFYIVVGDSDGGDLEVTYTSDDLAEDDNHSLAIISADSSEFQWVIDYEHSGQYVVTFTVTDDDDAVTSEDVVIIIEDTSLPPEWTENIPDDDLDATEMDEISFTLDATDPDFDDLQIELLNQRELPEDIEFDFIGWIEDDEVWRAEFTWQTTYDDEGEYTLEFNVTDHESDVSHDVVLTIEKLNREPVYEDIPEEIVVNDNELIEFDIVGRDPDEDDITLDISIRSNLPDQEEAGWELTDNDDNTWTFSWDPGFDYSDDWNVIFMLDDDVDNVRQTVNIEINNVNRSPEYTEVPEDTIRVAEQDTVAFQLVGMDPDGSEPRLTYSSENLPDDVDFDYNRNSGTGTFEWITDYDNAGEYLAVFTLSDAEFDVDFDVVIEVSDINREPGLIGDTLVDLEFEEEFEEVLAFNLFDRFNDPDGNETLEFDITQDPQQIIGISQGDNGELYLSSIENIFDTTNVNITATDNLSDPISDSFMVIVTNLNDPGEPADTTGFDFEFDEDITDTTIVDLDEAFSDAEGDSLGFDHTGGEHLGVNIDDENNLSINPDLNWYGEEDFTLIVEDFNQPEGAPGRDDVVEYIFTITVLQKFDDPPEVENPIELELPEGFSDTTVVNLDDVFVDPDDESMVYAVSAIDPMYAYIDYEKNLTIGIADGNFWGDGQLSLTATDESDSVTVYDFVVTVLDINDPPIVLNEIDDREYEEDSGPWTIADLDSVFFDPDGVGDPMYFDVEVSDDSVSWELSDENILTLSTTDDFVADEVEITVFCNDTLPGALAVSPFEREKATGPVRSIRSIGGSVEASYNFGFNAIEIRRDTEVNDVFTLMVTPLNDAPTWADDVPETAAGDENTAVAFTISAADLDINNEGDVLTLTMTDDGGTAALGATFTDNGDGTGDYDWQTDYTTAGEYSVIFQATDLAGEIITHTVTITVGDVNRAPVVTVELPDLVFDEGALMDWVTVANLDTIFNDVDTDDTLMYQFGALADPWQAEINASILTIQAPENYNGDAYEFTISAADDDTTVVDTFTVEVNSINDPPTAFALTEPVNNYTVINPWVMFKWEASLDEVEDSTVTYTLTIEFYDTTHAPLVKTGLSETELIMGRIEMYNSDDPEFTGEDTTYAQWSIVATDGEANVTSTQAFTLVIPPVGVIEEEPELPPTTLKLLPAYPNPFNDQTRINFELPWDGFVEVAVYDLAGRVVKTLVNRDMTVGRYTTRWDGYNEYGKHAAAGLYLCRLKIGDSDRMIQIILLR